MLLEINTAYHYTVRKSSLASKKVKKVNRLYEPGILAWARGTRRTPGSKPIVLRGKRKVVFNHRRARDGRRTDHFS
jgi:hypothetical protein